MNCKCPEKDNKSRNIKKCYVCGDSLCVFCQNYGWCPVKGCCHEKCVPAGAPAAVRAGRFREKCHQCRGEIDYLKDYYLSVPYPSICFCSISCGERSPYGPLLEMKSDGRP